MSSRLLRLLRALAGIAVFLLLWHVGVRAAGIPEYVMPLPMEVAARFWSTLPVQLLHLGATAATTLVGLLLALVIGILLALLVTYVPAVKGVIMPVLAAFNSMPKIAIAPLLLMWVGFGPESKIIITFLICFFPIVVAAVTGLNAPPAALIDLARSFGTPGWRTYLKIRIPYSIPYLFIGLKVAITLAVTGAVVGEFVAAKEGLGFLILNGVQQFNTPLAFAAMAFLAVLTVVFYGLVALAERLLIRWKAEQG